MLLFLVNIMASLAPLGTAALATTGNAPSIVVGGGRIGSLLRDLGTDSDTVVRRGDAIPADAPPGPIYVCTRNDDLASVVEMTPPPRRGDLCFLQNGMLGQFLAGVGLQGATQALLYLAVPKIGAPPVDGITDLNPEGLTCATGRWAEELAARLAKGGLTCNVKDGDEFAAAALEKHIFICATNVVGQLHGDLTVGEVYDARFDKERLSLVSELMAAGSAEIGVHLPPGTVNRLVAYGRSVPDFPTGIKEFPWRNGWFYDITQRALARGEADPLPLHTLALKKLGAI